MQSGAPDDVEGVSGDSASSLAPSFCEVEARGRGGGCDGGFSENAAFNQNKECGKVRPLEARCRRRLTFRASIDDKDDAHETPSEVGGSRRRHRL